MEDTEQTADAAVGVQEAAAKPPGVSTSPLTPPPPSAESAIFDPVETCKRDRMKLILALSAMGYLTVVTVIYAYCLIRGIKIDGEAATAMTMIAGFATGLVKDAYSFVFGSSQGSEDKTTALAVSQAIPTAK